MEEERYSGKLREIFDMMGMDIEKYSPEYLENVELMVKSGIPDGVISDEVCHISGTLSKERLDWECKSMICAYENTMSEEGRELCRQVLEEGRKNGGFPYYDTPMPEKEARILAEADKIPGVQCLESYTLGDRFLLTLKTGAGTELYVDEKDGLAIWSYDEGRHIPLSEMGREETDRLLRADPDVSAMNDIVTMVLAEPERGDEDGGMGYNDSGAERNERPEPLRDRDDDDEPEL